jgi:hypothetical protein
MRISGVWRGLAAVALAGGVAGAAAIPAQAASATGSYSITIGAKSPNPKVTGDTFVTYKGGKYASAKISGGISGAVSGDVAALLAEPFGATTFTATGKTDALTGIPTQAYSFPVTPKVATKYEVQVSTGSTVDQTSAVVTVYVTEGSAAGSAPKTKCHGTTCTLTVKNYILLPASAYRTESRKRWYLYTLVYTRTAHLPKYIHLSTKSHAAKARRVNGGEYEVTTTYVGPEKHHTAWFYGLGCTKDTESTDGIGLPGHHRCGAKRIKLKGLEYLG